MCLLALACGNTKAVDVPPGDAPVLHRLTEDQLNNALSDLFYATDLHRVDLPRDIPVHGFDNNALTRDASPYLVESVQRDLDLVTASAVATGGNWMACEPTQGDAACGRSTIDRLLPRAWRRPITSDESSWVTGLFDAWHAEIGFHDALQLTLLVVLQSPDFLYLVESDTSGPLTDHAIAARLSFFLWDTMPDAVLIQAADAGELNTPEQVREHARRMLADERSRASMLTFTRQWLGFESIQNIDPDPAVFYPGLDDDDAIGGEVADLKTSYMAEFDLFVRHTVWGQGTLDALLTSRQGFVSETTAEVYGLDLESLEAGAEHVVVYPTGQDGEWAEAEMVAVTLPSEQRAGFLTQGAFLAGHSHAQQPSPVLRGVFLRERLLCVPPILPPDDVPPLDSEQEVQWTTNRERFAAHSSQPGCAACHIAIDGVGFPFESYDTLGAFRTTDNGAPVDSTGEIVGTDVDGPVPDAIAMIETLAASRTVYDCAVTNLYRYGMHRSETDGDAAALKALQDNFHANGGVIPDLLVDFVSSDAFLTRGGVL